MAAHEFADNAVILGNLKSGAGSGGGSTAAEQAALQRRYLPLPEDLRTPALTRWGARAETSAE